MRQRLFRRLHYGINQARRTIGHGSNPHPERPWHGPRIQRLVPGVTVPDGCIYIVGSVSGKGEITQMGKIFRLVYGHTKTPIVSRVKHCSHTAGFAGKRHQGRHISWHQPRHLRQMVFHLGHGRYRSYYDVPYGRSAEARQSTRHLHRAFAKSAALGRKLGIGWGRYRSVQPQGNRQTCSRKQSLPCKDMARGHQSEVQGLLFDMIAAAEEQNIDIPTYRMVVRNSNNFIPCLTILYSFIFRA